MTESLLSVVGAEELAKKNGANAGAFFGETKMFVKTSARSRAVLRSAPKRTFGHDYPPTTTGIARTSNFGHMSRMSFLRSLMFS